MSWAQGLLGRYFIKRRSCHKKWHAQNIKYWGWMRIWTSEYLFRRRAVHRDMCDRPRSRIYPESNLSCWTVLRGSAGFFIFIAENYQKIFLLNIYFPLVQNSNVHRTKQYKIKSKLPKGILKLWKSNIAAELYALFCRSYLLRQSCLWRQQQNHRYRQSLRLFLQQAQ